MKAFLRYICILFAGVLVFGAARHLDKTPVRQAEPVLSTQPLLPETEPAAVQTTLPPETLPTEPEPQEERFLLTFVGDCTLGSNPSHFYAGFGFAKTVGDDALYPFRNVASYFESDEFTFLNLEGALCDNGNPVQKKFNFRGPVSYVSILTENSVEAVSLANNHTLDYGQAGYESTVETLNTAGIPFVERDSSVILTTENGLTIGIYGAVYYKLDVEDMTAEIRAMKDWGCDLIIFAPHWGIERTYTPTQEQIRVGYAAIDAGADIVCGSHPHVLQPIEEYNGGILYYSLGNFCFGGNIYPEDYDTALLQQEIIRDADGVRLGELTIIPACISSLEGRNNFQPTPYEEGSEEYARVLSKLDGSFRGGR